MSQRQGKINLLTEQIAGKCPVTQERALQALIMMADPSELDDIEERYLPTYGTPQTQELFEQRRSALSV